VRVAQESSSPEALDGERKTVTALFADIKGSMDLMEDLDPEEARAIVDPAIRQMIDAVHRYDGYVVQSTGMGSSPCSERRWPMRITRREPCTPRSGCRKR
jgi:class 3 adenylate cyclase